MIKTTTGIVALLGVGAVYAMTLSGRADGGGDDPPAWSPSAAARYLDGRQAWWATWPNAARDHGTFCVSCHTALPYAVVRPALRSLLHEAGPSAQEVALVANVSKRVRMWNEVAPFYPDQTRGLPKTSESRGTEAVLNALVLATRDAEAGTLADDTRLALSNMWALQMRTGDLSGAWAWLNFHLEPWESPSSPVFGAALAALATGSAPGYASSEDAKEGLERLRGYVARGFASANAFNRVMLLWASAGVDGLLNDAQRQAIEDEVFALQRADGGWSTSTLGTYARVDGSSLEPRSDGFATGLVCLALRRAGVAAAQPGLARGLEWLRRHQDPTSGHWPAVSLNKARDPASDAGRFMSDAATAYAVLALTR